tara:strand:- start:23184 stop:24356 length:1173 start_codon:yes stop_codon:yes gene_type:complete
MSEFKWPLMKDTISFSDRLKLAKFCLTTSRFSAGPLVKDFEKAWSSWIGSNNSLFVSSGSTANFLLVAAVKDFYGLKDGDAVLLPACTWVTNVSPIMQLGLRPVFCDINLSDFSFDIENAKKIAAKENIKMIFVTHLLGYSADIEKLREIFPNALIIEDVCESHGCKGPDGSRRGPEYIGGTFSFYFGHHMTTIEGGMVSTNNDELADLMRQKRCHGLARESKHYDRYALENPDIIKSFLFMTDGYNFRNTDLGACLGLMQLKRLDGMVLTRNDNYRMFHKLIEKFSDKLHLPSINDQISSFAFPLICRNSGDRPALMLEMEKQDIEFRPIVSGNLLRQPFLKDYMAETSMKNADILHNNGLYISNNHFVGSKEITLLETALDKTFPRRH